MELLERYQRQCVDVLSQVCEEIKSYVKEGIPVEDCLNILEKRADSFKKTYGLNHWEAHILYVNGEYRDDSDLGKLMHDFNCTNASDMYFDLLAEKTRYLKENPKGVNEMCKVMEDLRNESYAEGRKEQAKATAIRLNQKGLPIEDIADSIGFSIETVKNWLTPKAV